MRNRLFLCVVLASIFIPAVRLRGVVFTNGPAADTYFETYGNEDKNFGRDPILRIDQWGGRQAFLRFPINNIPRDKRLLGATLRLFITDIGLNEQGEFPDLKTCIGVFDVATDWTEIGLTYRTADGHRNWTQGPGIASPKYGDVGPLPKSDVGVLLRNSELPLDPKKTLANSWLELDLSGFIRERLRAGDKEINLVIRSSTLGRNYTFRSREAIEAHQRPQLVLEIEDKLPDFHLSNPLVTDWKPGLAVNGALAGPSLTASTNFDLAGSFLQKPAGSRLQNTDLKVSPAEFAFTPDVPGRYRVQCRLRSVHGPDAQLTSERPIYESAEYDVLSVSPHPRLYVTAKGLEDLRQGVKTGERLTRAFLNWVDAGSVGGGQGKFHDSGLNEGCENNSLAWLLTSDRRYLSNALAYAQRILQKPMREHFTDVHSATFLGASWVHAMAVHYDWCFDQLPAEHRQAVIAWLKEAAIWADARSGAPIAHNDGGARQCLLGSAALSLLEDDPEGPELYRRSKQNFESNLLPWLNDGGRGGRSGDGGEYEGLHAFYIVKFAWMSRTATGEDVFSESPFFYNRLRHILFGWYPRRLIEKTGAYSMRQYYSPSGDHIRMGFVGDTQPYQSAAALCARYRETPEAQAVRWLAGEWPTQWMQYTLRWAVLGNFDGVPARAPKELAWLDPGSQTVYARSDWSDDATWVLFENAPYVSAHDGLDSGTFEIFKGDLLAARTGNCDYGNIDSRHALNYLHRTISGNCLLINDPAERWRGLLAGASGGNDGGGERTNFPLTSSPDADTYLNYRDVFQRGQILRFRHTNEFTYAFADLTAAYNNPRFHGGELNQAKVSRVIRQLAYLREVDTVVVSDQIDSLRTDFKKTWLLHSLGELAVLDGQETKVDDGEFHYSGASRVLIRNGWLKPVPSFARCLSVTLLPENPLMTKVGGRVELPVGQTESFPGDHWHGQHRHHHIKDFWVSGTNYPPGEPPESRWFGEPTSRDFIAGTPDETGGRGKWRVEICPSAPAMHDVFLHVLCPRLGLSGEFPGVIRLRADNFEGALIQEGTLSQAVFFGRGEERQSGFSANLPENQESSLWIADLAPGEYILSQDGKRPSIVRIAEDGVAFFANIAGPVELKRRLLPTPESH
jgi:hypothetical protein